MYIHTVQPIEKSEFIQKSTKRFHFSFYGLILYYFLSGCRLFILCRHLIHQNPHFIFVFYSFFVFFVYWQPLVSKDEIHRAKLNSNAKVFWHVQDFSWVVLYSFMLFVSNVKCKNWSSYYHSLLSCFNKFDHLFDNQNGAYFY